MCFQSRPSTFRLWRSIVRRFTHPRRSALAGVALLAVLVPRLAPAIDPIAGLSVIRGGDDLILSWSPSTPPVDGYRVYKADDESCASVTLVYAGPLTSYTDTGAFQDLNLALYGVAAFLGPDEGPRTGPVYKYPVVIPATQPGTRGGFLTSIPYHPQFADTKLWCEDLNWDVPPFPFRVVSIFQSLPAFGVLRVKFCASPIRGYDLVPSEAYLLVPDSTSTGETVFVWGVGDTPGTVPLPIPWVADPSCDFGFHFVSLPRDHDYTDLADVAAQIPEAVRVLLWNPNDSGSECDSVYVGLSRPTPLDPWTGPNLTLKPGEGVVIAVATPTEWTPRRRCTAFSFGGGAPGNLAPTADAGGPYDTPLCLGGVIGIWLDGTGSFDPDNSGPMTYQWTSDCSGTITNPNDALTPAVFDCNPCQSLSCSVQLAVTDFLGAIDTSTQPVYSRRTQTCVQAGNSLKMGKSPNGLKLDWNLAPAATNYVLLADDRPDLGSPTVIECGPSRELDTSAGTGHLELFQVDAMDDPCAVR